MYLNLRVYWLKIRIIILMVGLIGLQCSSDNSVPSPPPENLPVIADANVHNIILFIGDGMGISQMSAARLKAYGAGGFLNIEKMPVTGLLHNHAIGNLITDSAAAATALAAGFKTRNGMISVLPDGTNVRTILEEARDRGYSTGLVATSSITHATPACFAAHVRSRSSEAEIARQLTESQTNVLLGGGKHFFVPDTYPGSRRNDSVDLIARAKKHGYQIISTRNELMNAKGEYVLGLFTMGALKNESPEPSLAEMTQKSIAFLNRNKKGFFLMVEGSQIDWGSHDNDIDKVVRDMRSFDEAVKVGLEFAARDKHTLVVVTADHETGGLAIIDGEPDGSDIKVSWASGHHTCQPVPVFAYGPHSILLTGVHDNTFIPQIFARLWGFDSFPRKVQ